MAEPVSTLGAIAAFLSGTIAEIGGAIATLGTVLSALQGIAITLYVIIRITVTVTVNIGYSFFILIYTTFYYIFNFWFIYAQYYVRNYFEEEFGINQTIKEQTRTKTSLSLFFKVVALQIKDYLLEMFQMFMAIGIAFSWVVAFTIVWFIFLAFVYILQVPIFVAIDYTWTFLYYSFEFTASFLNTIFAFAVTIQPAWNEFVDIIMEFLKSVFKIFCPNELTLNLEVDCPIFYTLIIFVKTSGDYSIKLIEYTFDLIKVLLISVGDIICPNGQCPIDICKLVLGNDISLCYWKLEDPRFIIRFIGIVTFEVLTFIFFGFILIFFFVVDVFVLIAGSFALFVGTVIPNSVSSFFSNTTSRIVGLTVPPFLEPLKQLLVAIYVILDRITFFTTQIASTILSFIDILFCWIFRQVKNCFINKICTLILSGIVLEVAKIFRFDLFDIICVKALAPNEAECRAVCESCEFLAFGLKFVSPLWYSTNKFYRGFETAGYVYGPSSLVNGCINRRTSIFVNLNK